MKRPAHPIAARFQRALILSSPYFEFSFLPVKLIPPRSRQCGCDAYVPLKQTFCCCFLPTVAASCRAFGTCFGTCRWSTGADDEIGYDLKLPQRMVMSTLPEGRQTNPLARVSIDSLNRARAASTLCHHPSSSLVSRTRSIPPRMEGTSIRRPVTTTSAPVISNGRLAPAERRSGVRLPRYGRQACRRSGKCRTTARRFNNTSNKSSALTGVY